MKGIVGSRGFALVALALVLAGGLAWYVWPEAGWLPLAIALLPWLLRVVTRQSSFKRTHFDLPLAVFLLTAAVGVWAAYNREAAWAKFWILAGAILLFYALAHQPGENLWPAAGLITGAGGLISLYFLLTYDWHAQPADLQVLGRAASWLMSVRPPVPFESTLPNTAGGILAISAPFPVALALHAWKDRSRAGGLNLSLLYALLAGGLIGIGLLLSSSRGAWLALAGAMGIWLLWAASASLAGRLNSSPAILFTIVLAVITGTFVLLVLGVQGGLLALVNSLPGIPDGYSRFEIARNTLYLVRDFPFTGGGLGSFPGLYSQYMMVTPYFLFAYSHNFYLDLLLEQGIFGFCAGMFVLLGGAWLLLSTIRAESERRTRASDRLLHWAVLASLIALLLHGFVDDAIYGQAGVPLLFLSTGFAIALMRTDPVMQSSQVIQKAEAGIRRTWGWNASRSYMIAGASLIVLLILLSLFWFKPALSSWYADLGSVLMARAELSGWPTGKWADGRNVSDLDPANAYFQRSLTLDRENITALYRSGLIDMLRRDFETACSDLNMAYYLGQGHRGVQKVLGYCYTWSGEPEKATGLLVEVPEARKEMQIYSGWWKKQGRPDLADKSKAMAELLQVSQNPFEESTNSK